MLKLLFIIQNAENLPVFDIQKWNHLIVPGVTLVPETPPQRRRFVLVWFHLDQIQAQRDTTTAVPMIEKPYLKHL